MKLRVFNPEHDIALAHNQKQFTAPHAARQLHADFDFVPAFLHELQDDNEELAVIVGDAERARTHYEHVMNLVQKPLGNVRFVTLNELDQLPLLQFEPWGWDATIVNDVQNYRKELGMIPDLDNIREISSRQWCAEHLQDEVRFISDKVLLKATVSEMRRCVLKSPWSSTGRGIRYVDLDTIVTDTSFNQLINWAAKIIDQQGGIVVEPYYNKVKDFGMEFKADADGSVHYLGLSLFHTVKGAYTGNILACEADKQEMLHPFVSKDQQQQLAEMVINKVASRFKGKYQGLFGVDFMVVSHDQTGELDVKIAEINLRTTMGHIALALCPKESKPASIMSMDFDGSHYKLWIKNPRPNEDA